MNMIEKITLSGENGAHVAVVHLIDGATKTAVAKDKFEAIGRAVYFMVPSPVVESPRN